MAYLGLALFLLLFSAMGYMAYRFNARQSQPEPLDIEALWHQVGEKVKDISTIDQHIIDRAIYAQGVDLAAQQAKVTVHKMALEAQYKYECRQLVSCLLPEPPITQWQDASDNKVLSFADFILNKN